MHAFVRTHARVFVDDNLKHSS
jgi:hypothetical protein